MATPKISFTAKYPGTANEPSYLDLTLNSESPLGAAGAVLDAWCVNAAVAIHVNPANSFVNTSFYPSNETGLVSSSVASLPVADQIPYLDSVSWLLNAYNGENHPYLLVQYAIWDLVGQPLHTLSADQQSEFASNNFTVDQLNVLVSEARAQHGVYVPKAGESMAVVLDPHLNGVVQQPLVVEVKAAQLGNYVWHDENLDGIQDADEEGIAGVQVDLVRDIDGDGKFTSPNEHLATTQTDANGLYSFMGLTPGYEYQVQFTTPAGFKVSPSHSAGSTTANDSEGLPSYAVTLAPGENNTTLDSGFYKLGSLGDTVWYDTDRDGVQDADEKGVGNATVKLFQAGADGEFGTADDVVLGTQSTDADGKYLFTDLKKGEYQVEFSKIPANHVFTKQDGGTKDDLDSDANATSGRTGTVSLAAGQDRLDVDAGIVQKLGSLGDTVWYDKDRDGLQDAGEKGVKDVTVKLFQAGADGKFGTTDDVLLGTDTTDADGKYLFTQLHKGEYQVEFSKLPADFVFTKQDVGATKYSTDSDANVVSGRTDKIVLGAGQNLLTIDAGIVEKLGSLGDTVWYDRDRDGVQDANENGVYGATVKLFQAGADGKFGTKDDVLLGTKSTDANGKYLFTDLKKGDYQVEFSKLPAGYTFTKQNIGSNDGLDSDASATTGRTGTVSLDAGQSRLDVDAGIVSYYTYNTPPSYPTYSKPTTPEYSYPKPSTSYNNYYSKPSTPEYSYTKPSNSYSNYYSKQSTPEYSSSKQSNSYNYYTKPSTYEYSSNKSSSSYNKYYTKPSTSEYTYSKPSSSNSYYSKPSTSEYSYSKPSNSYSSYYTKPSSSSSSYTKPSTTSSYTKPTSSYTKPATSTGSYTKPTTSTGSYTKPSTSSSYTKPSTSSSSSSKKDYSGVLKSLSSLKSNVQSLLDSTKSMKSTLSSMSSSYGSSYSKPSSSYSSSYSKPSSSYSSSYSKPSSSYSSSYSKPSSSYSSSSYSKPSSSYSSSSSSKSSSSYSSYSKPSSSYSSYSYQSEPKFKPSSTGSYCYQKYEGAPGFSGTVSPIALDLDGDGAIGVTGATSSHQKDANAALGRTVRFDIDGDGTLDTVEWFDGSGDGILIDNRDGQAATDMNGKRLFGDQGGKFANGYLKLELFDTNGDGKLTGEELEGIQLWVDDGDAQVEEGEIQTLAQQGITEISTQMALTFDEEGRSHMQSSATREDGSAVMTEDVWFAEAADVPATTELVGDEALVDELLGAEAPDLSVERAQALVAESRGEAVELLRKILSAQPVGDATPA